MTSRHSGDAPTKRTRDPHRGARIRPDCRNAPSGVGGDFLGDGRNGCDRRGRCRRLLVLQGANSPTRPQELIALRIALILPLLTGPCFTRHSRLSSSTTASAASVASTDANATTPAAPGSESGMGSSVGTGQLHGQLSRRTQKGRSVGCTSSRNPWPCNATPSNLHGQDSHPHQGGPEESARSSLDSVPARADRAQLSPKPSRDPTRSRSRAHRRSGLAQRP